MAEAAAADGRMVPDGLVPEALIDFLEGLGASDKLSWDWSDDTKGEGTPADICGKFSQTWGAMVDSFNLPSVLHRGTDITPRLHTARLHTSAAELRARPRGRIKTGTFQEQHEGRRPCAPPVVHVAPPVLHVGADSRHPAAGHPVPI